MADQTFTHHITACFPDLAEKTAIVTGASGNIGSSIAEFLGRQKMKLVLASRSEQAGMTLLEQLQAQGVNCIWVTADLAAADGVQKVFDAAMGEFGGVDVLVNNAALLKGGKFCEMTAEAYHLYFEKNVRIMYELSRLVTAYLIEEKRPGVILHVSSVGGLRAHRNMVGYDMSKGAVDSMTRAMALELGPYGIRVNAVAPGHTPHGDFRPLDGVPLGRTGTGEDVAALIAFLASNAGAYITGQILYVDGGLTAQLTPPGIFI